MKRLCKLVLQFSSVLAGGLMTEISGNMKPSRNQKSRSESPVASDSLHLEGLFEPSGAIHSTPIPSPTPLPLSPSRPRPPSPTPLPLSPPRPRPPQEDMFDFILSEDEEEALAKEDKVFRIPLAHTAKSRQTPLKRKFTTELQNFALAELKSTGRAARFLVRRIDEAVDMVEFAFEEKRRKVVPDYDDEDENIWITKEHEPPAPKKRAIRKPGIITEPPKTQPPAPKKRTMRKPRTRSTTQK